MSKRIEQVIIIGGGPAGLAAALYLGRAGLSPLVLAGSPPGGQLMLTTEVENYPGIESVQGPELIMRMRKHAEKFGARIIDVNVKQVDLHKHPFIINISVFSGVEAEGLPLARKPAKGGGALVGGTAETSPENKTKIITQSLLIATGAKALWLGLPSEERLRGKGVSACATCDGFFFRGKKVGVVGGGDTAMEEALTLAKFAKQVYLIHRRSHFRASKIMQERVLTHPKIKVIWNSIVEEVIGNEKVTGVRLKQDDKKSREDVFPLDGLFVAIGHKPDTDLFRGQIEMDQKGYIMTSQRYAMAYLKMQNSNLKTAPQNVKRNKKHSFNSKYQYMTSVNGVFAAGDNTDHLYRQASTAAGMGVAASLEIEKWLESIE